MTDSNSIQRAFNILQQAWVQESQPVLRKLSAAFNAGVSTSVFPPLQRINLSGDAHTNLNQMREHAATMSAERPLTELDMKIFGRFAARSGLIIKETDLENPDLESSLMREFQLTRANLAEFAVAFQIQQLVETSNIQLAEISEMGATPAEEIVFAAPRAAVAA